MEQQKPQPQPKKEPPKRDKSHRWAGPRINPAYLKTIASLSRTPGLLDALTSPQDKR